MVAGPRKGGFRIVDVQAAPNDQRALSREGYGGLTAYAATAARDDANFSSEPARHYVSNRGCAYEAAHSFASSSAKPLYVLGW
jgi:hypothetical protein